MNRSWTALVLAGCFSFQTVLAQQADSSSGSGSSSITPSEQGTGSGAASVLIPSVGGETTPPAGQTGAGAGGGTPAPAPAAPIEVPSAYGNLPVTLTPGQGRFNAPPLRFSVSLSQGYDDNIFSAPTNPAPGAQQNPRVGSSVTNASLVVAVQSASPRTAYTLDAVIGGLFYWDRPGSVMDYNDRLEFVFYHRFNPRLSVSTAASLSLLSQPNFNIITAPTNNTGNYLVGNAKIDLTYLWTARMSTVASYNFGTTLYENQDQQGSDLFSNTLGFQFRYLLSPRTTAVVEVRGALDTYPNTQSADSTSQFFLLGLDSTFSPRLRGTVRAGMQTRIYETAGIDSQVSPYFESTLSYIYGHQSNITWSNWFGLQPGNISSQEQTSFRTSIGINHVLTGRITASLSANYNHITTAAVGTGSDFVEDDIGFSIGLQYVINRHITLTASYNLYDTSYTYSYSNYYRNQFFLGGTYAF